jgi:hypothetical protein
MQRFLVMLPRVGITKQNNFFDASGLSHADAHAGSHDDMSVLIEHRAC